VKTINRLLELEPLFAELDAFPHFAWINKHHRMKTPTGMVADYPVDQFREVWRTYERRKQEIEHQCRLRWLLGFLLAALSAFSFYVFTQMCLKNMFVEVVESHNFGILVMMPFYAACGFGVASTSQFVDVSDFKKTYMEMLDDHLQVRWTTREFADKLTDILAWQVGSRAQSISALIGQLNWLKSDLTVHAVGAIPTVVVDRFCARSKAEAEYIKANEHIIGKASELPVSPYNMVDRKACFKKNHDCVFEEFSLPIGQIEYYYSLSIKDLASSKRVAS
jgi:hypothetical protein